MESASWNVAAQHHDGGNLSSNNHSETTTSHDGIDNQSRHAQHDEGSSSQRRTSDPLPAGLSALIMAATSQLSYLAEVACSRENEHIETANVKPQSSPIVPEISRDALSLDSHSSRLLCNDQERNHSSVMTSNSSGIDPNPKASQNSMQSAHNNYNNCVQRSDVQPQQLTSLEKVVHQSETAASSSSSSLIPYNEATPTIRSETTPPRKLTFPEILMSLAILPDNIDTITFLPDGKFFAIRPDKFTEQIISQDCFEQSLHNYDRFLDAMNEWGFIGLLDPTTSTDIAVFRHPQFIKGEWELCRHIHRSIDHSHTVRFQSLNEYRGIDGHTTISSTTDDSASSSNGGLHHPMSRTTTTYGSSYNDGNITSDDGSSHVLDSEGGQISTSHPKRRLSPSFVNRRESVSSVSSQKQKIDIEVDTNSDASSIYGRRAAPSIGSADESETVAGASAGSDDASHPQGNTYVSNQLDDAVRSKALAITTNKLKLHQSSSRRNSLLGRNDASDERFDEADTKPPLIDQAVSSATHSIVTNAIATLLRDEVHTKETYLKHEKELSKSCIPGVIPISTQLFSPGLTEPLTIPRSTNSTTSLPTPSKQDIPILSRSMTLPFSSVPNNCLPIEYRSNGVLRRNSLHTYDPNSYNRLSSSITQGASRTSTPMAHFASSSLSRSDNSRLDSKGNASLRWKSINTSDVATRRSSLPIRTSLPDDFSGSTIITINDQAAGVDTLLNLKHHFSSSHVRGQASTRTNYPNVNSGETTSLQRAGISEPNAIEGQSISRSVRNDSHFVGKTS
jgi:HSF-type DNA-binding